MVVDSSIESLLWFSEHHCLLVCFVSLWSGRWYKVKCGVLIVMCRSLVASAKRSFVTGGIAWKIGPWMKTWSYTAGGRLLRGSFEPGTTVVVIIRSGGGNSSNNSSSNRNVISSY